MTRILRAALLLAIALPAAAQVPPPVVNTDPGSVGPGRVFGSMSPAGRATMFAAMRPAEPGAARAGIAAARDRMLTILDADRLDTAALKRAMDDEREIANRSRAERQSALVAAYQQLSVADRRAFVADARALRGRMESRVDKRRERRAERMMRREMVPPVAPPAPPR